MDTLLGIFFLSSTENPKFFNFHPETALFRNLGVNLQPCLCGVPMYASAQGFDFLDLAKNCSFQI